MSVWAASTSSSRGSSTVSIAKASSTSQMFRATRHEGMAGMSRGRSPGEEGEARSSPHVRKQVVEGEPVEVWKLVEEQPEDVWNHIFLRESERKERWCDMACLRIAQYKDEQTRRDVLQPLLDRKSAGRCKKTKGEVSMVEYDVRGWLG